MDPARSHLSEGGQWSIHPAARVTRVPSTRPENPGPLLEIRFDGTPLDYAKWLVTAFPDPAERENPAISGPDATPFGDGIANLLRFALGRDPAGQVRLPAIAAAGGVTYFRFPYDPALHGLRWTVEATGDPSDWSAATVLFDSRVSLAVPDASGWLSIGETATAPARFYRLRVELAE